MSERKKNYGIELLRLLSMFYVVLLHTLGHGGILEAANKVGGALYNTVWFVEIWAYCAVDVFALISGYIGYESKKREINIIRLFKLWGTVLFYSLFSVLICKVFSPDTTDMKVLVQSFFPLTNSLYWYFTAYVGAFLFFPLINCALDKASDKLVARLMVLLGLVLPVFEILTNSFKLMNGYSPIWLIIMFFVGASINKLELQKKVSKKICIITILTLIIMTWLWKLYGINYDSKISLIVISKDSLVSYISPTILIVSICYLLLFSQLNIDNRFMRWIALIGGGSSFAIYLLNDNRFIRERFLKDALVAWAENNPLIAVLKVLGFAVSFVVGAIIIDRIRLIVLALIKKNFVKQTVDAEKNEKEMKI